MTFVVHKEWLENIAALPIEQQDKVIADFVRYGVEMPLAHEEDAIIQSLVNMIKGRIDYSKDKYQQKVEMSKGAGRRKKIDNDKVRELARQGMSAAAIAEIFGVSKSTIDHSEGWRSRKELIEGEENFVF